MDFYTAFPEANKITDEHLRELTRVCWEETMRRGGFTYETLLSVPFTLLVETDISLLEHTQAIVKSSLGIAKAMQEVYKDKLPINLDYLISGAILHDVGKMLEYEKAEDGYRFTRFGRMYRHPFSGSALAREFGLPLEVIHIIATHAKEGDGRRRTPEAIIVNKADFANFESVTVIKKER